MWTLKGQEDVCIFFFLRGGRVEIGVDLSSMQSWFCASARQDSRSDEADSFPLLKPAARFVFSVVKKKKINIGVTKCG